MLEAVRLKQVMHVAGKDLGRVLNIFPLAPMFMGFRHALIG